ncbi:MAG: hypothetical protein SF053_19585 [Bacteroidia bacterium]|nr:hypothetical protein [Bacteroidia bacterium]
MRKRLWLLWVRLLPLRSRLQLDGGIILGCLVLSVGLWIGVSLDRVYQIKTDVPLAVDGIPADKVVHLYPGQVAVQFESRGAELVRFRQMYDTVHLPYQMVSGLSMLDHSQLEDRVRKVLPAHSQRLLVVTDPVIVEIESQRKYRVPLRLKGDLQPAPTYGFENPPVLMTDSVSLYGPQGMLESVEAWYVTAPGDILVTQQAEIRLPVDRPDTLPGVQVSPQEVTVRLSPRRFIEARLRLPVVIRDLPPHTSVRLDHPVVQVRCLVPEDMYSAFMADSADWRIQIPYASLQPDFPYLAPEPSLPSAVRLISQTPRFVSFVIVRDLTRL